ncbi:glutathione S-transferase family protein [Sphingomonas immobilis]|uniref:Glutathione S-transferase family protein n=1 Tax=Sphingomonas immobilis TaxID=3063997 RepID=A0ABT8ZY89_9SPHN|nr:glutathione S-transferase family protein [Sphingomonas sp. CA1-15]MDO7842529.1 glutathione S-transferase family protein [Sphingomonas sp. CA1-15]
MTDLILHEYARSGNCYKIRLTAAHLGIALQRREYDIMQGETRTPAFLASVSANGRIPVLQIGDFFLPESNAACVYLARESALVPDDALDFADMLRWMFWEQYNHETCVAVLRFWRGFVGEANLTDLQRAQLPGKVEAAAAALALMEDHLAARAFFVGERFTLADIGLYAYTHVAGEGGIDLSPYPAIVAWLARVAAQPGHVAITA